MRRNAAHATSLPGPSATRFILEVRDGLSVVLLYLERFNFLSVLSNYSLPAPFDERRGKLPTMSVGIRSFRRSSSKSEACEPSMMLESDRKSPMISGQGLVYGRQHSTQHNSWQHRQLSRGKGTALRSL